MYTAEELEIGGNLFSWNDILTVRTADCRVSSRRTVWRSENKVSLLNATIEKEENALYSSAVEIYFYIKSTTVIIYCVSNRINI